MAPRAARSDTPIKADNLTPAEQAYFENGDQGEAPSAPEPPAPAEVAAPEPSPEVEGAALEPSAGATTQQPDKTVPLRALTEAREETKEWKNRFATLEQRTNLLLERFGQQPQTPAQPAPQAGPEMPDPQKDPAGYLLKLMEMQGTTVNQVAQRQQQYEQQQQVGNQISQLQNVAMSAEQEFAATTPDYNEAAQHLRNFRSKQLEMMGYTPSERNTMMAQEALGLAARAFQRNENPAAMIYEMAKISGYAQKTAEPQPVEGGQPQNDEAARKLQTVQRGQGQSLSLSGARGAAPKQMSATRLLEMSPEEFAKFAETNPKEFQSYMGN